MSQAAVVENDFIIPLIDFSGFLNGTPDERKSIAKDILHGFQSAGFVYLQNLPISPVTRQRVFDTSGKLFRLSSEAKKVISMPSIQSNRGYSAQGQEQLCSRTIDFKETFHIGSENDAEHENIWPSETGELIGFKETISGFYDFCSTMSLEVVRAIAIGIGIDEDYFNSHMSFGDHKLRLLHYPEVRPEVFQSNAGQVRAGPHTDYGAITLLFQDNRGGLQVKTPQGKFVDAPAIENTVIVNAGDLLARWSNDKIKSTVHRVVEPSIRGEGNIHPARYSIAFFANPRKESFIEAIPGTFATEADKKYQGISSGDYYVERLNATY
ncbi:hypothetical protein BJX99DRAFT_133991 [Aspergillus californicus]